MRTPLFAAATLTIDSLSAQVVSVAGTNKPVVFANSCGALGNWSPAWIVCSAQNYPPSAFYEQGALVMAVKPLGDGGKRPNLKGRLNFSTLGSAPGHILTLSDSDFAKTIATANNRPVNDPNDAFIGYDQGGGGTPVQVGISFRSTEIALELHWQCRRRKKLERATDRKGEDIRGSGRHSRWLDIERRRRQADLRDGH